MIGAARLETIDAAAWYDEQRRGLGVEFLDAVQRTLDLATQRRMPGAPVAGIEDLHDVRQVGVSRFPYLLVVVTSAEELTVVAVMHERRRPSYWIDRISP